jgi:chemotaxis methyl-accepting protein methylase
LEAIESFAEFDLIVLSEIGYYFPEPRWKDLVAKIAAEMPPGATLVAAHWTGHSEDHETSGDSVHRVLRSNSGLCLQRSQRHAGFLLDRWARP